MRRGVVRTPRRASQYAGSPHYRIISPLAPEFTVSPLVDMQRATWSSAPWYSANDPLAFPFVLNEACVVVEMGWVNGTSAGGNVDMGIYDTSWNRKVSCGSTAAGSSNAWAWVNVTDTPLPAGRYYLVLVRDNITANRLTRFSVQVAGCPLLAGMRTSSTDAFPLPDPLTDMGEPSAASNPQLPACAIAVTRAHA